MAAPVKLPFEVETNALQEMRKMAQAFLAPQREADKLEKEIRQIGDSEMQLSQITDQNVRKRVDAYRREKAELQNLDRQHQMMTRSRQRRGRIAAGMPVGGMMMAGKGGGFMRGLGAMGSLSAAGTNIAGAVMDPANRWANVGGAVGTTGSAALNLIPAVGPALSAALMPIMQQIGMALGSKFDEKPGEEGLSDKVDKWLTEQKKATREQEKIREGIEKLIEEGRLDRKQAEKFLAQAGVAAQTEEPKGEVQALVDAVMAHVEELRKTEDKQEDLLFVLKTFVERETITRAEAASVARAFGVSGPGDIFHVAATEDQFAGIHPGMSIG